MGFTEETHSYPSILHISADDSDDDEESESISTEVQGEMAHAEVEEKDAENAEEIRSAYLRDDWTPCESVVPDEIDTEREFWL